MSRDVDLLVVGGGVNGAAVARDAAGRGLSVYLAERGDYAGATSSASSRLIHGGLRYLEHLEFRLVREALHERDVLMRIAPHLVHPQRFLLPVTHGSPRPAWMLRLGLWLYDRLAGSSAIEPAGRLQPADVGALPALRRDHLRAVLHYPDCRTDDARLTLEMLLDARARGADVGNRRDVTAVRGVADGYAVTVRHAGGADTLRARFVVNTAGPWANELLARTDPPLAGRRLRLVRGSHIIVATPPGRDGSAYTLQNGDGRVVFVLPWAHDHLIIGTTEVPQATPYGEVRCSDAERDYLLATYNAFFAPGLSAADVVSSYSGVRPLIDDRSASTSRVSRGYAIDTRRHGKGALITVYGGKLTTHRSLAECVMQEIAALGQPMRGSWTADEPLPGGCADTDELACRDARPVPAATWTRWVRTYGARAADLFERVRKSPGGADEVAPGVPRVELQHAVECEDARTATDFLRRRTQLFLALDGPSREAVRDWFAQRHITSATGS